MSSLSIWFWQRLVTPHMANLAVSLASRGHKVTYIAEETLDDHRKALGWQVPELAGVTLSFARTRTDAEVLAAGAEAGSIHLTQGLRSNGNIAFAQKIIRTRGLRHFVIMETIDQSGTKGWLKQPLYAWHLFRWRRGLNGILAIGADTPEWLRRLAPNRLRIMPFAYFLKAPAPLPPKPKGKSFRFLFVGSLVPGKRVDLLLHCLRDLFEHTFSVEVVGDGPMRADLETLADEILPGRVDFRGVVPMSKVSAHIAASDCLVLPSVHDGWGAVVSEALMMGTPVICSAACGARRVVEASGAGGVFATHEPDTLRDLLASALAKAELDDFSRDALRKWAGCLNTVSGAEYLESIILAEMAGLKQCPLPPWDVKTVPSIL